jgi:N-acetylmuramoyl-L-alanine amidase
MRRIGLILLLVIGAFSAPTQAASTREPNRLRIGGVSYVHLDQWAQARRLRSQWLVKDQKLRLSSQEWTLTLTVHSKIAVLNGVNVMLSEPVVSRARSFYVGQVDINTALNPLLFPGPERRRKVVRVCLDAGHGGKDPGNQEGVQQEKKYTLLLARQLRDELVAAGLQVVMTRTNDIFIEPAQRPARARRLKADLFLSLHLNALEGAGKRNTRGVELFCMTPVGASSSNARGVGRERFASPANRLDAPNIQLAYRLQKALVGNVNVEDRGIKRARFAVLRDAQIPAVLIEAGFMSHPDEGRKLYDTAYRQQIAKAIARGVIDYKRFAEKR